VIAIDINENLLKRIDSLALHYGFGNIITKLSNFLTLDAKSEIMADLSILAGTLSSLKTKDVVVKKVYELTKPGGKLLAVEWVKEETPMGPPKPMRLSKKELVEMTDKVGFKVLGEIDVGHYHYGIVFEKPEAISNKQKAMNKGEIDESEDRTDLE
jgi:ubiquinone/menaquinone biosynthesis C-methylase UbiE